MENITEGNLEILVIHKKDLIEVIKVHKASFKGFFLTELGDHFLRVYYNCVRKDNRGILLGLYKNEELIGFCAATVLSKGFNKHLVKNNFLQFSLIGLWLLFTRTSSLIRLLRNFNKSNSVYADDGIYAELLSIGVSAKQQGQGVGKKLLLKLENEMNQKGCRYLSLTTDFYDNESTLNFYNALGYKIMYDFIAYPNRRMYRMKKKLD